jgi:ketosteroid isomerase-like protein
MSHENVKVVRRIFEHWETGDFRGALALFDDGLVTRRVAPMPDPESWHGHQGLRDCSVAWFENFGTYSVSAEEFIDAGEHVVVRVREEGRGIASGASVVATFPHVFGLCDGKVVTLDFYATEQEALDAVGPGGGDTLART